MRYFRYALLGLLALAALFAGPAPVAQAATFTVDSTGDAVDLNAGDGTCKTAGGVCTLRAAIEEANALADHQPGISTADDHRPGDYRRHDPARLRRQPDYPAERGQRGYRG